MTDGPAPRRDFPVLGRAVDGEPITYLDSAATSLSPRVSIDAVRRYDETIGANVHRGRHSLSEEASVAYERARRVVARWLGADPDCVVFTRNATEGLNLVARGLALAPGDRVLADRAAHHSNLLPWMRAAEVRLIPDAWPEPAAATSAASAASAPLDPDAVADALDRHRPRVLALSHASNVTGAIHPVSEICTRARERGVITVVDAAQSAPHVPLDVDALGADFTAFSGHKLGGPTGVGVLYGRPERLRALSPLMLGGGTVLRVTDAGYTLRDPPHCFEAGTPNIGGALGLAAAIEYLDDYGFDRLARHEAALADTLEAELADLPGCSVLMSRARPRLAIASIAPIGDLAARVTADHLAQTLSDTRKIMVRSGTHCCQPLFSSLGLDGAVRASCYLYNDAADVRRFACALRRLLELL